MRLPDNTQRLAAVGRTGSGKTQAALWHLSLRDWDLMPWVIYDFKRDPFIARIGAEELPLEEVPDGPGLYVTHPLPGQDEEIERQLWGLWERGNAGVFVDEGYMMGERNAAFNALLTQGRSKQIPMIILSQRPVWISRFMFSESDFYQVFHLNDERDRKTVGAFVPYNTSIVLPEFWSFYYDVKRNETTVLKPVPSEAELLETYRLRLQEMRQPETISLEPRMVFV